MVSAALASKVLLTILIYCPSDGFKYYKQYTVTEERAERIVNDFKTLPGFQDCEFRYNIQEDEES